jgi:hypothetical protein
MTPARKGRLTISRIAMLLVLACTCACTAIAQEKDDPIAAFEWERLADLPRPLAGQAAGVSHGAVIVAGGTNFPVPLAEGGAKTWYDAVHLLEPGASAWSTPHQLPRPRAYAANGTIGHLLVPAGDRTRQPTTLIRWLSNGPAGASACVRFRRCQCRSRWRAPP